MGSYNEIRRVMSRDANDLPVSLLLQVRLEVPPEDFYCLSWRTLYPSGRSNRRFYYNIVDGFWRVPFPIALELLDLAHANGMLDVQYDDQQIRHDGPGNRIIDSRELSQEKRREEWNSITIAGREHVWSRDSVFVIIQVPDCSWRKIMIVDPQSKVCTFRSTTIDPSYTQVILEGMNAPLRMDNAMQDASAAMMQTFRQTLRSL